MGEAGLEHDTFKFTEHLCAQVDFIDDCKNEEGTP